MTRRKSPARPAPPPDLAELARARGGTVRQVDRGMIERAAGVACSGTLEADLAPRPRDGVVCEGVVEGRAVPWKSPTTGRHGGIVPSRDYSRYKSWQAIVAGEVKLLMGRRRPYGGPVRFDMTFYLRPNGRTRPDRINLAKAFEDAVQGIAIQNDVEIESGDVCRVMSATERERVEFRVTAI
jgi:Holliday junction resolvase RusA-like endonuclease